MAEVNNYPIVLAHGIARFDFLRESLMQRLRLFLADLTFAPDRTHYFKGVASHLARHGFEAHHSAVSFASSVETRASDLRQEILRILRESGQEKVHIIGHSMGGLDSRQMIVNDNMADKVASLTTIGTPHLGTSFADWGLSHGGADLIKIIRGFVDMEGFLTLTIDARRAFNESAQNVEATNDVLYQTYAGWQSQDLIFTPLKASWQIIHDAEGANDGLVSAASQRWVSELVSDDGRVKRVRQFDFPFPVDHLNETGWWDVSELRQARWWRLVLPREKRRFETAVKHVYLQIARDVTGRK